MKTYLSIFFILSTFLLSAQDFKIIEVTSQKWTAGRARTGYGIKYNIKLVCKKRMWRLGFDKFWVNKEALKATIEKDLKNKKCFSKNDTIIVNAEKRVKFDRYGDPIIQANVNKTLPIKYDTPALLSYHIRKRNKSIAIPKIKEKKQIFYQ